MGTITSGKYKCVPFKQYKVYQRGTVGTNLISKGVPVVLRYFLVEIPEFTYARTTATAVLQNYNPAGRRVTVTGGETSESKHEDDILRKM